MGNIGTFEVPSTDAARVLSRGGRQTSAPLLGGAQWSERLKLDSKQIDSHHRHKCRYRATEAHCSLKTSLFTTWVVI